MKSISKNKIFKAISIILTLSLLWQSVLYAYPVYPISKNHSSLRIPIGAKTTADRIKNVADNGAVPKPSHTPSSSAPGPHKGREAVLNKANHSKLVIVAAVITTFILSIIIGIWPAVAVGVSIVMGSFIYKEIKTGHSDDASPGVKKASKEKKQKLGENKTTRAEAKKRLKEVEKQEAILKEQDRVNEALAAIPLINNIKELEKYLKDRNPQISSAAKLRLEQLKQEELKDRQAQSDSGTEKEMEKARVEFLLAAIPNISSVEDLVKYSNDKDKEVRSLAKKRLKEVEKQEAIFKEQDRVNEALTAIPLINNIKELEKYLKDRNPQVSSVAKLRLKQLKENDDNQPPGSSSTDDNVARAQSDNEIEKEKTEKAAENKRIKENKRKQKALFKEQRRANKALGVRPLYPRVIKGLGLTSIILLIMIAVQHYSASELDATLYSGKSSNYGTPPAIVLNIDEIKDGNDDGIYDNIILSHAAKSVPGTGESEDTAGSAAVQVQQNEKPPYYHGQTFLIIGRDGGNDGVSSEDPDGDGGKDGGRADVLILLNVSPDKKISIIPIPRDSKVKIPGHSGYSKINAALNGTNYERQVATVENTLGVEVDGYVLVDFNSAAKVIQIAKDVLGIKNKFDIAKVFINSGGYKGIDFDDVKTLLSLEGALRSRTGKGLDANVRAQNNARFVGFLLKQGVLFYNSDNEKGVKLISEVLAECETDITDEELLKVIKDSDPENLGDISYYEIPGRGGMEDGTWYFRLATPDNPDETLYEHVTGQKIMRSNL